MQEFSQILLEAKKQEQLASSVLTAADIDKYINKVKRQLPKNIQEIIYLTKKYDLLDGTKLKEVMNGSARDLAKFANETVSLEELTELQKQLTSLKQNVRLLPQFQSVAEREDIMSGKLFANDLTIDLSTPAGKNAVAKMYTPMVYKIANQYEGKSSLDKAALISAGMYGLAEAMKKYDPAKSDKPFKTFAAYNIQQAILQDINEYSHSLSGTNWYAAKNYADKLDAVSIDSLLGSDDEDYSTDHLAALGTSDDLRWIDLPKSEQEYWESLYKIINAKFSVKECNIFYRYFGLGEFWGKKEKSKDIAKSYGMSEGNIRNSVINKMLKFLMTDPKSRNILQSLRTIYSESIMKDLIYFTDKQEIYEALLNDDMFILLEELNKWNNKDVFTNTITNILETLSRENAKYIIRCLKEGFKYIDDTFKKHKPIIVDFLKYVYPTESFVRVSDVTLIEHMVELSDYTKEYKIEWKN